MVYAGIEAIIERENEKLESSNVRKKNLFWSGQTNWVKKIL